MKNIKFRARDDVNNRMVYDFSKENQFKTKEGCYSCGISADKNAITASLSLQKHDDFAFRHVKYIELMQYTGLNDKNGVEIYEGDVVQYCDGEYSYIGIVESDCYQFFINGINPDDSYDFIDVSNTFNGTSSLEIIGNVYENPDFMEV